MFVQNIVFVICLSFSVTLRQVPEMDGVLCVVWSHAEESTFHIW